MIQLNALLRVMFISGFLLGLIVAPFFSYDYLTKSQYLNAIVALTLTPIFNGIFVAAHGFITFPLIKKAVKNNFIGLGGITLVLNNDKQNTTP